MSLLDVFQNTCVLMEKRREIDGEGGFKEEWVEGVNFSAAIVYDTSIEARVAERDGVTSLYTVTVSKNTKLDYHDVFKRLSDGKIFRVTSDSADKHTPSTASFQVAQFTAEEWELTK